MEERDDLVVVVEGKMEKEGSVVEEEDEVKDSIITVVKCDSETQLNKAKQNKLVYS